MEINNTMVTTAQLEEVIASQRKFLSSRDTGVMREVDYKRYIKTRQVVVITGVRRSGKSTLLSQFAAMLKDYYYINFDDERLLDFSVGDFDRLLGVYQSMYSSSNFLLDEVQNIDKWERFIRRLHDSGFKVFITGSNARLLSSELATHLTGRYFAVELYPFSFREYLAAKKITVSAGKSDAYTMLKAFESYLEEGGFPEFVKWNDREYLKRVYEDILFKDIMIRYGIRDTKSFRQLADYLFSNVAKPASYNALKIALGFSSVTSVKQYIAYLQGSYLLFELYKYDHSLKKQYVSNKKIYCIDNGVRNTVSFSVSNDRGRLLENLVFLELKRKGTEVYYFKSRGECDFIIREKNKTIMAIQVCTVLDENNMDREVRGLTEAGEVLRVKERLILTVEQEEELKDSRGVIRVLPVWKWLL